MGRKRNQRKDLPQRVYFKHSKYYFVDRDNKWHNLGADYYKAMIEYAAINTQDIPLKTINHAMDYYISNVLIEKAPKTQKEYLKHIKVLRKVFGGMLVKDLRPSEIYKYMNKRPKVSANREKAILSQVFKVAIQLGLTENNPCKQVVGNPEKARDNQVHEDSFVTVYKMASEGIQIAMDIALVTGLRQGDILKLNLFEHWTDNGLEVKTGKTGQKMLYERTSVLEEIIKRCIEQKTKTSSSYLVRSTRGQPYTSSGFQKVFGKLVAKAIEEKEIDYFQFRDIRAWAGTVADREDFLGHQDPSTYHRHYRRGTLNVVPIEPKILDNLEDIRQEKLKNDTSD